MIARSSHWILVGGAALAMAAPLSPCRAQEWRPDESRHGALTVGVSEGGSGLKPADRRAALALADSLLAVFRRDPAISSPLGYIVTLHREVGSNVGTASTDGAPFYAGVSGAYWGYFLVDGKPSPDASGKTPINAYVNNLLACPHSEDYAIENRDKPMLDGGPLIFADVRQTGEFRGHPIYNGQCVVLTNRHEPPFLPVTRERYRKLEILGMRAKVERFRQQVDYDKLDPKWRAAYDKSFEESRQIIAEREAELARMSAEDRAAPAAVRHSGVDDSTLVSADDPDGNPLVTINPAFYDRSLPSSAAQIVVVNVPFVQSGVTPKGTPDEPPRRAHGERIRDGLDWAALEAMVRARKEER
ncbi:MAG: hypothetical protein ACM3SX_20950 [Deltaproteobacteria bacterium]